VQALAQVQVQALKPELALVAAHGRALRSSNRGLHK
jgi:hypothetical protein